MNGTRSAGAGGMIFSEAKANRGKNRHSNSPNSLAELMCRPAILSWTNVSFDCIYMHVPRRRQKSPKFLGQVQAISPHSGQFCLRRSTCIYISEFPYNSHVILVLLCLYIYIYKRWSESGLRQWTPAARPPPLRRCVSQIF